MMFRMGRKGAENVDSRIIFNVFLFIGILTVLLGFVYTSLPDETINSSSIDLPNSINTSSSNQSIVDYIDYASSTVANLGSGGEWLFWIIALPTTAVFAYILIRLLKPFS